MWRPRARRTVRPDLCSALLYSVKLPPVVAGQGLAARANPAPLARCRRAPFIHVVGYRTPTAAFAGEVDTLLDPATY